jgi:hypothetical protein
VLWLKGFRSYDPIGYEWRGHWCGPNGAIVISNQTDRTITARLQTKFRTTFKEAARLTIKGGDVWSDVFEINDNDKPAEYEKVITIPPGSHIVNFRCQPSITVQPNDSRNELFKVIQFRLTEIQADAPARP